MAERPDIKPGDWIRIGKTDCVVTGVFEEPGDPMRDCEVVFNPQEPTNRDAQWNGDDWEFVGTEIGGRADHYKRLSEFVSLLKRGKYA